MTLTMTKPKLTTEQFTQPLYLVMADGTARELTRRQEFTWGQKRITLRVVAMGLPTTVLIYDRYEGGDPLSTAETNWQPKVRPGDNINLTLD
jgi:hypothetical protein